jgi:hypothetical protein
MGTMLIETRKKTETEMVGPSGKGLKEDEIGKRNVKIEDCGTKS